ncbi:MAG: autotransporter-associated beta strand repeat-containing protein, partial [Planctomycetales bacterium]|nr:autotransporter-associated beta strand repeat-containing protein [Planctomycetales bacterium]
MNLLVVNSNAEVTILGTEKSDALNLHNSPSGIVVHFADSGPVTVPVATRVRFEAGDGDDFVTLDFANGNPLPEFGFSFDGGRSSRTGDSIKLQGTTSFTAQGQPQQQDNASTLNINGHVTEFLNTEHVTLANLGSVQWTTNGTVDDYRVSDMLVDKAAAVTWSGTSGKFVTSNFVVVDTPALTLNLGSGDGASTVDVITVDYNATAARLLTNLTLQTGAGRDELHVNLDNATPGANHATITWDAGADNDVLVATTNSDMTLSDSSIRTANGAVVRLENFSGEHASLTGGAAANRFTLDQWSGVAALDGGLGTDTVQISLRGGTVTTVDRLVLIGDVITSASSQTATIQGDIDLGSTTHTLRVSDGTPATDLQIDASLVGTGGLIKDGVGTAMLTGNNSYSGTTDVAAGTLNVRGDQSTGRVNVRSGATLTGDGRVGATSAAGTVSPGNGIGQITVAGLALSSTARSQFELRGEKAGVDQDVIVAQGSVTLAGVLSVTTGFVPAVGSSFMLIDNDGTDLVRGNFTNLGEGATFTVGTSTFQISYRGGTGNDVVLTTIQNTAPKFPNRTITEQLDEGGIAILRGDISEPDPTDIFFLEVNWGDGTPLETFAFAPGTPTAELSHRYLDDPTDSATYQVDLLWRDQHGGFNTGSLPVRVANVAPQIAPIDNVVLTEPGLLLQPGTFSDPGADRWQAFVDYGDGGGLEPLPMHGQDFTLAHQYHDYGFYNARIIVQDDDGGTATRDFAVRVWPLGSALPGDANRDGHFSSQDLVLAFAGGAYETDEPATWETGDWNNDGVFNSSDLVLALSVSDYDPNLVVASVAATALDTSLSDEADPLDKQLASLVGHRLNGKRTMLAVDELFADYDN